MITALRIFLIVLSGLLIARDIGTIIQYAQVEITEEYSSTQKAESTLQQQAEVKKITRKITVLTHFIRYTPVNVTPEVAPPATGRWLRHRALLI
ncbi:MAG: hypothetical protein KIT62_08380 [Cyclobacteriaceae bacterium]|nr:hypothetical protein [Cyclobacteriaceae bacterium]